MLTVRVTRPCPSSSDSGSGIGLVFLALLLTLVGFSGSSALVPLLLLALNK